MSKGESLNVSDQVWLLGDSDGDKLHKNSAISSQDINNGRRGERKIFH